MTTASELELTEAIEQPEIGQDQARRMLAALKRIERFARDARTCLQQDPSPDVTRNAESILGSLIFEARRGVALVTQPSRGAAARRAELTWRQREVLEAIEGYIRENGCAPTMRELSAALGFVSPNAAMRYIDILEAKGIIRRRHNKSRSLVLID